MLASEVQVESLMNKLEEAISYAETVESRLDRYYNNCLFLFMYDKICICIIDMMKCFVIYETLWIRWKKKMA